MAAHAACVTNFTLSGTYDIRNATITDIDIETDYFEYSDATGALFVFVFLDVNGTADLTRAIFLALDMNTSLSYTIPYSLRSGRTAVFVYDIESDGLLSSGESYPAVDTELFIHEDTEGISIARAHQGHS